MGERAVAKEPRKHCERACRQHLIDEWLLPFERLRRAATGQRVLARFRIRNLRIEFRNGSQPDRAAAVCGVQRLAEHILTAACVVAEVEPVDGAVIRSGDCGQDGLPRRPCIDTANNQVRTCRIGSQRILVKVLRVRLPPQTPEEIDAVDQHDWPCSVQHRLRQTAGGRSWFLRPDLRPPASRGDLRHGPTLSSPGGDRAGRAALRCHCLPRRQSARGAAALCGTMTSGERVQ